MIRDINQLQKELCGKDLNKINVYDWDLIDNRHLENNIQN